MKKYIILIIAFLFSALCLNVFAQTKSYPFEVLKTGSGDQSIIFIPGFASSGDVWNETKAAFENNDCSPMVAQMTAMNETQFYDMQKQTMPRLLQDASKLEMVVDWSVKSDRKTFADMYCDFFNTDLRVKIATIKCPSLILLESYFINLKPAIDEQYKNLKTADFRYANKGLHFIMYDDKEWYLEQLNTFLKS